jgi:hypothetical protein
MHAMETAMASPASAPAAHSSSSTLTTTKHMQVGSIYSTEEADTYIFKCCNPVCGKKTFGRWYDFRRHYNGAHAKMPTVYWCDVGDCARSKVAGDNPFPRKDKLNDHVQKMHRGRSSG